MYFAFSSTYKKKKKKKILLKKAFLTFSPKPQTILIGETKIFENSSHVWLLFWTLNLVRIEEIEYIFQVPLKIKI